MATNYAGDRRGGYAAVTLVALWLAVCILPWILPAHSPLAARLQRRTVEARLVHLGFTPEQAQASVKSLSTERLASLASTLGTAGGGFAILGLLSLIAGSATVGLIFWVL